MKMDKSKLQKLIHRELANVNGISYGDSLLIAIEIAKKILRLERLESFQDSSTELRAGDGELEEEE